MPKFWNRRWVGYVASVAGIAIATLILSPFAHSISGRGVAVSTVLMMTVVLSALAFGTVPGIFTAALGTASLEYFYARPDTTTRHEFIGFACFLLISLLVGQLSSRAKRRADEIQVLYDRLQASFQQASQLEAVRRNERFKSTLLDTLTHDFRTPLTSIMAAATSLVTIKANGTSFEAANSTEHLANVIIRESGRLDRFIDEMIELAKVEASNALQDPSGKGTLVEEIFSAALSRAEPFLDEHKIDVACEDDVAAMVNPRAIAQVLFSLLQNAAKYSPKGTTIRLVAANKSPGLVEIAVEDEGPGIPAHVREKVFEKFYRGDDASSFDTQQRGLGVGLAIAGGIIAAHGGKIRIEDKPFGPGARFVFSVEARLKNTRTPESVAAL
jgi:K+-sensing histidine kinase KdpD